MKKSLLILLAALALAPIANCGIGGIPGNFTFDSVGPGKSPQPLRETAQTYRKQKLAAAVAGMAHPGKDKASLSAGRDQRSRLQPL
jgi:hypothetical protein